MSPTLLELIVAVLLVWLAWQIGVILAPRILASFLAFWRSSKPPFTPGQWPEKNITPPSATGEKPSPSHGNPRK